MEARRERSGTCWGEEAVAQDSQVADGGRYGGPRRVTHLVWVQASVIGGEIAAIPWRWLARAASQAFPLSNDAKRAEHRA
jgi:hypothetical protein